MLQKMKKLFGIAKVKMNAVKVLTFSALGLVLGVTTMAVSDAMATETGDAAIAVMNDAKADVDGVIPIVLTIIGSIVILGFVIMAIRKR